MTGLPSLGTLTMSADIFDSCYWHLVGGNQGFNAQGSPCSKVCGPGVSRGAVGKPSGDFRPARPSEPRLIWATRAAPRSFSPYELLTVLRVFSDS